MQKHLCCYMKKDKNMSKVEAPVLLITFNRPDNTIKVFEQIRKAKVPKLYIANDAPRENNKQDEEARLEIRKIIELIDWDCEVHTLFQEKNLGCGYGPATAISWAFENEDRLIILEDDCVPSLPFFDYCNELLEKYKNDTRIWLISGRSHHEGTKFFEKSDYIFSYHGHTWGWATWKRTWEKFDIKMNDFLQFLENGGTRNLVMPKVEVDLYNKWLLKAYNDIEYLETHAWDIQFVYAQFKNAGLSIVPSKNLIHNIGYVGTHFSGMTSFNLIKASENYEIKRHPVFVLPNFEYEKYHFLHHIRKIHGKANVFLRILRKIKKIVLCQK